MTFKAYKEKVTLKDFINKVRSFNDIDTALASLDDNYIEFYMLNINNKKLKKELQKLNLLEDYEELIRGFNRYVPDDTQKIVKKIKYKGQYLVLTYDKELQLWFPSIQFRSITTALKYIKKTADYEVGDV